MARLISTLFVLLAAAVTCCAQHKPWEWQEDQNKYSLFYYEARPLMHFALDSKPPVTTEIIYAYNRRGFRNYAGHVALSYYAQLHLKKGQYRNLHRELNRLYREEGLKAVDIHFYLETRLKQLLSYEQYAYWQNMKRYPEYDMYYLALGQPVKTARDWNLSQMNRQ